MTKSPLQLQNSWQWNVRIMSAAAAAAKSLQLCPTLCDSINNSLKNLPVTVIYFFLPSVANTKVLCCKWERHQLLRALLLLFSSPVVSDSVTQWTAARQASLSLTISRSLPKFMSITLVMPSNHLILWCPLLLLPSIFLSIGVFSKELSVCIR